MKATGNLNQLSHHNLGDLDSNVLGQQGASQQELNPQGLNSPTSEEGKVQKSFQALQQRWPLTAGVLVSSLGLASVAASLQDPMYTASGTLLFQRNRASSLLEGNSNLEPLKPSASATNPLKTQAVILKSAPILEPVIEKLELKNEAGELLQAVDLLPHLTVEPVAGTEVIQVSFESEDAELATAIVNELIQSYIANDLLNNRAETRAAREFIAAQLTPTQKQVEQAAEALLQFRDENQIVSLQEESARMIAFGSELDSRISRTQAELVDLNAQAQSLKQKSGIGPDQAVALNSLNESEGVQAVLTNYQNVQEQLAQARTVYIDESPTVRSLQRKEAALRRLLGQRVREIAGANQEVTAVGVLQQGELQRTLAASLVQTEVARVGLEQQLRSLLETRATYRKQASRIPSLQKRQEELERSLAAAQGIYESLLEQLQAIRLAESQNVGNARVIQQAKTPRVASRKLQLMLLAGGAFVGLSLGVAVAFLADWLDRSIRTVSDAKALFNQTLVGLIPQYETLKPSADEGFDGVSPRIVAANSPRSIVNESYQMLRANLKFMSSDRAVQSLVITSSVPGEGKSEVSANLAAAMAQVGRRVLIVDADLRNPSQHHLWGLINGTGLSNVIVGQTTAAMAIQQVTPRLAVLTAGVIPPNPLALLDSKRMAQLISALSEDYDYIIFDTPPLAGMADAAVLGTLADGLLLVARPGVVNLDSANAAKLLLERSAPNILGMVANGVDLKRNASTYFYYGCESQEENRPAPIRLPVMLGQRK